jgi:rod shape-determining protein MreD
MYFGLFSYLELPLLATLYLSMGQRSQVAGVFIGGGIGLVQDALANQPLGLFGIVKTLLGYAAASLGVRLDTGNAVVRAGLAFLALLAHESLAWLLRVALLRQTVSFYFLATLIAAVANAALAVVLFHLLDKLREEG